MQTEGTVRDQHCPMNFHFHHQQLLKNNARRLTVIGEASVRRLMFEQERGTCNSKYLVVSMNIPFRIRLKIFSFLKIWGRK